jgi:hypothetical protein
MKCYCDLYTQLVSAQILLYTDADLNYYKVAVANGTRLLEGSTVDTCKAAGMNAVCPGSSTCSYNSPLCMVTPLSTPGCTYLASISKQICNYVPKQCPEVDRLFVYMNTWSSGELGRVGSSYHAYGKDYVSGDGEQAFYAFCVICGSCEGKQ